MEGDLNSNTMNSTTMDSPSRHSQMSENGPESSSLSPVRSSNIGSEDERYNNSGNKVFALPSVLSGGRNINRYDQNGLLRRFAVRPRSAQVPAFAPEFVLRGPDSALCAPHDVSPSHGAFLLLTALCHPTDTNYTFLLLNTRAGGRAGGRAS